MKKDKIYDFLFKCGAVATTATMLIGVAMMLITGIQKYELELAVIAIRTAVGSAFISLGHIGLILCSTYFAKREDEEN